MAITLSPEVEFLRAHYRFQVAILESNYGEWVHIHDPTAYYSKRFVARDLVITKEWLERSGSELLTFNSFGIISYHEITEMCHDHGIKLPIQPPRPRFGKHRHEMIAVVSATGKRYSLPEISYKCIGCKTRYQPAGWKKIYE